MDNTALAAALNAKADYTACNDITFAANKGPVVLSPNSAKHRLEADDANNPVMEEIA